MGYVVQCIYSILLSLHGIDGKKYYYSHPAAKALCKYTASVWESQFEGILRVEALDICLIFYGDCQSLVVFHQSQQGLVAIPSWISVYHKISD